MKSSDDVVVTAGIRLTAGEVAAARPPLSNGLVWRCGTVGGCVSARFSNIHREAYETMRVASSVEKESESCGVAVLGEGALNPSDEQCGAAVAREKLSPRSLGLVS